MRVPSMHKYILRKETAADYIDMPLDVFEEHVTPFLDSVSIEDVHYYLRSDIELVIRMFFKAPPKDNVSHLHPVK